MRPERPGRWEEQRLPRVEDGRIIGFRQVECMQSGCDELGDWAARALRRTSVAIEQVNRQLGFEHHRLGFLVRNQRRLHPWARLHSQQGRLEQVGHRPIAVDRLTLIWTRVSIGSGRRATTWVPADNRSSCTRSAASSASSRMARISPSSQPSLSSDSPQSLVQLAPEVGSRRRTRSTAAPPALTRTPGGRPRASSPSSTISFTAQPLDWISRSRRAPTWPGTWNKRNRPSPTPRQTTPRGKLATHFS